MLRFHNSAAVLLNLGIDKRFAQGLELSEGAFLVAPHQQTVAGDASREYSG